MFHLVALGIAVKLESYIYISYDEIRKEFSRKLVTKKLKEKVTKILEDEIKELDNYMTGNMYTFTAYKGDEFVISMGGYFDENSCLEDSKYILDDMI